MTKRELAEQVTQRSQNLSRRQTEVVIDSIFGEMIRALCRGEKVEIRGFGSFKVKNRNAKQGRNPKSGEAVDIPAKRVPFFKVGRELRGLVAG